MTRFADFSNHLFLVSSTTLWLLLAMNSVSAVKIRSNYIIHMDRSHMPEPFISHHHWHSSIVDSLTDQHSHSSPSIIYSYGTVFHGFSASLTPQELHIIKNSLGFVSAYRDKTAQLETTRSPEFLNLNPAAGIWPASKFGENAIIGVIDSGIWPESESFHDRGMSPNIPTKWKGTCQEGQGFNSSMCNRKLIGAQYFNKGLVAEDGADANIGINSTRDSDGHGTHVAAIAAGSAVPGASYFEYAKGTAQGISPRARLAIYKVNWPGGMSGADVLAGIEKAVEDGVDVLSISLSFLQVDLYEDPLAIAAFGAMEKGVVVSISAGNGDRSGDKWRLRNGAPWAVTVAAGSVDRTLGGTIKLGNGVSITGWSLFPVGAIIENFNLVYNRTVSACNSSELMLEAVDHSADRSIIVCDSTIPDLRTDTRFQMLRVTELQLGGGIYISNDARMQELRKTPSPGLLISPKDGATLIRYARGTERPTASLKFQQTFVGTRTAPIVASYSLEGPGRGNPYTMKPDIMAPGTWILAAWVPNVESAMLGKSVAISSDYNLLSGTSMATPHIAGVAALLKAVHPEWSPHAIKSAMMTTANPLDNTGKPITDNGNSFRAAEPYAMGSGQVDPNRAVDPGLVYDATPQDYVNFLCALNYTKEQLTAITRSKASDCSKSSLDLNYPAFVALCENADASGVLRFKRTVTNVGEGPATYRVSVKTPSGSEVRVSPQKLVFGKKNEKQSYSVTVRCTGTSEQSRFGDLVWIENNGKRRVRSPVIVSPFA